MRIGEKLPDCDLVTRFLGNVAEYLIPGKLFTQVIAVFKGRPLL